MPAAKTATGSQSTIALPRAFFFVGLIALLGAAWASFILVYKHFNPESTLPGCGPGSGCAELARSKWGSVPGLNWPVSFLGFAYFTSMAAAWFFSARRTAQPPQILRLIAWLGIAASLMFSYVMLFVLDHFCPYCFATHCLNLVFFVCMEAVFRLGRAGRTSSAVAKPAVALAALAVTFTAVSAGLAPFEMNFRRDAIAKADADADRTVLDAIRKGQEDALRNADAPKAPAVPGPDEKPAAPASTNQSPASTPSPSPAAAVPAPAPAAPVPAPSPASLDPLASAVAGPIVGRHRRGPEAAPIRIVAFFDYQCKDCKRVEAEIETVLAAHPEYSFAVKYFPMSRVCNKYLKIAPTDKDMHENACWAARAAETASIQRGEEGFWEMHHWLFERGGAFTDQELADALPTLGFDPAQFTTIMQSQQVLDPILEDIDAGQAYGLMYTPLIYVNGVELRGWEVPGNVPKWLDRLAKSNPPVVTAENDRPPLASEKYIEDWKLRSKQNTPANPTPHATGAEPGPDTIEIVLYGDLTDDNTSKVDADIRAALTKHANARYTFRHYPWCRDCNTTILKTLRPFGCRAAAAAEAASFLSGNDGYWKMHKWIIENRAALNDDKLRAGAASLGLDADNLFTVMALDSTQEAILEDIDSGSSLGLTSMPSVWINGKLVPRPMREGDNVIERILSAAMPAAPAPK